MYMYTDLELAVQTGTLSSSDGNPKTEFSAGKRYIDGYALYDLTKLVTLIIYLDGKVPAINAGIEITVMKIEQVDKSRNSVISTYSSKKQMVYNPDDVPKQIEEV